MAGQQWSVGSLGGTGVGAVAYLSERLRSIAQPEFRLRQFVDAQEAIGKGRGDTWLFDKTGNVATAGGTLVETNTIPETNYVTNQGTGTITEYGNSIPYTLKVETLSQFAIEPLVEGKLRDDMVKVIESACGDQYVATEYIAVCSSTAAVAITTNGTATVTATANLSAANVRTMVNFLKTKLVPTYSGGAYVCVGSVNLLSGLHSDVATGGWIDISKYTGEFARNLHNGEIGKFYNCRFIEETGYFSNTIGNTSIYGSGVMFGADNVYEAVASPEEIKVKNSADYDRDLGLAWYALLGFKIVWAFATDAEQHIMYISSA